MIISRSIHVAANVIISSFLMAEWYFTVYIYHIFLIYSSVHGYLGCFHVLASHVALVVKNLPVTVREIKDAGSIPGSGRSPGERNGSTLQYSCLENPMDRGAWLWCVALQRVRHNWSDLADTHVLTIVSNAIGVHELSWIRVFSGYMPRGRIAWSYGNTIFNF